MLIGSILLTIVILIFSEVTPKTFAAIKPEPLAFFSSLPLKILQKISQRINLNKNDNKTKEKLLNSLKVLGNILGILNNSSQEYFQYDLSKKISSRDIELMIEERDQARINKDFKKADLIREKLSSLNIVLEDDGKKTTWKKLSNK